MVLLSWVVCFIWLCFMFGVYFFRSVWMRMDWELLLRLCGLVGRLYLVCKLYMSRVLFIVILSWWIFCLMMVLRGFGLLILEWCEWLMMFWWCKWEWLLVFFNICFLNRCEVSWLIIVVIFLVWVVFFMWWLLVVFFFELKYCLEFFVVFLIVSYD